MKFKKLKKIVLAHGLTRRAKKLGRMKANVALKRAFKFCLAQVQIRPRIRLFAKLLIVLVLALTASSQAIAYLEPKEAEIKINGQPILIGQESTQVETEPAEIEAEITSKRSPFDFKLPVEGYVSQGYRSYHRAVDIATGAVGVPIHALGTGQVEFTGYLADGKGNVVVVNHGDGLKSLYAHMGKIYVGVGNQVDSSSTLGTVGLTGRTTGAHVHLEVYDRDVVINPANVLPN